MGILLGLIAAIGWGAGDFLARFTTHRIGTYRSLFFVQFIGGFGLTVYLLATGQLQWLLTSASWQAWAWAILAVGLNIVSSLALFRAFEVGILTLVSPIAASYAAVTVVLAFFSGETLTLMHNIGIGVVLLGVIVVATPLVKAPATAKIVRKSGAPPGLAWAMLASLGYGATFWLLGFYVAPSLGGIAPIWLIRVMTPCLLAMCAPLLRQPLQLPRGRTWWFIAGDSVFDTLAHISYTFGLLRGQVAIVTVLSSLYSVVTVILAGIFLHERVQRSQWVGIGAIFLGIALVNI
jgi:drug/metabolite transporter (DMT)-like permease